MPSLPSDKGDTGYSGTDSYRYIDELIRSRSGELRVVSPFIGIHYARMLVKEAEGKKVRVITSSPLRQGTIAGSQEKSLGVLRAGGSGISLAILAYLIMVVAVALAIRFYLIAYAMAAMLAAYLLYSARLSSRRSRNLSVGIANGAFVHEKLYISDSAAIVGSANLTYAGTHSNIEHIELIRNVDRVASLSKHFDELWAKTQKIK